MVGVAGLKGSTEPRTFTPPLAELTPENSLGFEVADFAESILGLELRPWQKWLFIHALELDPVTNYETFRFRTVIVEVGRQNGKTLVMVVLGLWRMYMFGASEILSAAQSLNVAEETLADAFKLAKQAPELARYLPIRKDRGKWVPYMSQTNGAHEMFLDTIPPGLEHVADVTGDPPSWYVAATNGSGGRSFSADLALLDELREHKNFDAWDAIAPTTVERYNSQVWGFSNAGDRSSVVLNKFRNIALRAIRECRTEEEQLGLFSWSARPDCSIFDRDGWAQANPSLGYGARDERTMLALARQAVDPEDPDSSEAGFRTEYLCQTVEELSEGKVTEQKWAELADHRATIPEGVDVHVGVDVALDGEFAHIAVAAKLPDGRTHVEIAATGAGYRWVPHWLAERRGAWFGGRVGMQVRGCPASALVGPLLEMGIEVDEWQGAAMTGSTLGYFDAIRSGDVVHVGDGADLLSTSAIGVRHKDSGSTFIWDRSSSLSDATPFVASNIAWWMATKPEEQDQFESAYAADDWDEGDAEGAGADDEYLLIV